MSDFTYSATDVDVPVTEWTIADGVLADYDRGWRLRYEQAGFVFVSGGRG